MLNKIFKLRPSIAVTKVLKYNKWQISFFKTDIRTNTSLSLNNDITDVLFQLDGNKKLQEIIDDNNIKQCDDFCELISFLNKECILLEIDDEYNNTYNEYHKVYNFLSNYNTKVSEINSCFKSIQNKKVLIIGLGGVGTWIVQSLVMSGIKKFVLVDNDTVDITNLHRQATFFESDVGQQKLDIIERRLKEFDTSLEITKINQLLDENFFESFKSEVHDLDLIINCADKPSVEVNSLLVGEFCMANKIPHIIGGGYNFHLSLLAQTVIPYETACVKCFEIYLKKLNEIPEKNIKKLRRNNRKIGSMLSQSTIAGSIISLEAIKILSGLKKYLATTNIRKEFNFTYSDIIDKIVFEKRNDCPWCSSQKENLNEVNIKNINSKYSDNEKPHKYYKIRTNNLKIDTFELKQNEITALWGESGSGKSSLAFNTIYDISQYEYKQLQNKDTNPKFDLEDYDNIIPTVSIKQGIKNSNSRSTLYSFTKISKLLSQIFAIYTNKPMKNFSLNNHNNLCIKCNGRGFIKTINIDDIINKIKPLNTYPIKYHIKSRQSVFNQKLDAFCNIVDIDMNKSFNELSTSEQQLLLNNDCEIKVNLSYKVKTKSGKTKIRNTSEVFYGIERELLQKEEKGNKINEENLIKQKCILCDGVMFNEEIQKLDINGTTIKELMLKNIFDFNDYLEKSNIFKKNSQVLSIIKSLKKYLSLLIENNIGYLTLTRTIPSLSGGELQKLQFCNAISSKLSGMLYIIDEISANIYIGEYKNIWNQIENIKNNNNSILLVEHEDYFINKCTNNVKLGPGAGVNGGKIEAIDQYVQENKIEKFREALTLNSFIHIEDININNINKMKISLPKGALTVLCGKSGAGKSSIAKFLSNKYDFFTYIDQKPISSTNTSTIGSFVEVIDKIRDLYATEVDKNKSIFSFNTKEGQCENCHGKGEIVEKISFSDQQISYICPVCDGKRFNDYALTFKYKGYNIYELLNLTIEQIITDKIIENQTIKNKLSLFVKIGLDYLTLFRSTKSISGGEAQRLKIIKYINSNIKDKFFIFDEPFNGIYREKIKNILDIFDELIAKGASILIIEHKLKVISNCDYIIEIGYINNKSTQIIFQGTPNELNHSTSSDIVKYF